MTAEHEAGVRDEFPHISQDQRRVIMCMNDGEWVRSFASISAECGLPEKKVGEIARQLYDMRLAARGPICNDDTGAPNGSGYWLTYAGISVQSRLDRASELAALHLRAETAERERDEAIRQRENTHQWYAERRERLSDFMKEKGFWIEFNAILVNGTLTMTPGVVYEPPTYGQILNGAKHRAKTAEAQVERLTSFVQCLIDNDPEELCADGGITVLDVWRKDVTAFLRDICK